MLRLLLLLLLILTACTAATPHATQSPAASPAAASTRTPIQPSPTAQPIRPTATPLPSPTPIHEIPFNGITGFYWFAPAKGQTAPTGWIASYVTNSIYRSTDGGLSFQDVTPVTTRPINLFALDSLRAWSIIPGAEQSTIYRTEDGGLSWHVFTAPYPLGAPYFFDSLNGWSSASKNGCGAGTCWVELYQTSDGGQTWQQLVINDPYSSEPDPTLPEGTVAVLSGMGFWFSDPQTLWYTGSNWVNVDSASDILVWVSRNAGQTWQTLRIPFRGKPADNGHPDHTTVPVFLNPSQGYLAAWYSVTDSSGSNWQDFVAVFYTPDGGRTWKSRPPVLNDPAFNGLFYAITVDDLLIGCGGQLCASHDAGLSWQPIETNLKFDPEANRALAYLDFIAPQTGFALIGSGPERYDLYTTTDGGKTWTPLHATLTSP